MGKPRLRFRGKLYDSVAVEVVPEQDFRLVLEVLELPTRSGDPEVIKYAVLELINNSLRAHREGSVARPIETTFACSSGLLRVTVRDFGGGFDPAGLPYELNSDISGVDLHSSAFQEYRKRNSFKRFGIGALPGEENLPPVPPQLLQPEGRGHPLARLRPGHLDPMMAIPLEVSYEA